MRNKLNIKHYNSVNQKDSFNRYHTIRLHMLDRRIYQEYRKGQGADRLF